MTRDRVLETVNELPQNFELDLLLEKLVFIEKVQKGLDQLNNGNTLSHEEVKQRAKSWQK